MWGEDAIRLAKKHNKLIFVSIGYAACHWCHVMERESFENEEVAGLLNSHFIPIKVDREERPDVDRIYMNYVQATTGSGGWPLNVFITPDLEPVFGGTYWPGPNSNTPGVNDQASFLDILKKISEVWRDQEERCLKSAKDILQQLKEFTDEGNQSHAGEEGDILEIDLLEEAYQHFAGRYDKVNGGFSVAPKFPTPSNLAFLLRLGTLPAAVEDTVGDTEIENAKYMVISTLRHMTRGGIHDHIGHGLYDQAQLLSVYLDAFLVSKDLEMLGAVYDIADYLCADALKAPSGGFYSAEDADSLYRSSDTEKREGAFYVWTRKEFDNILDEREAEVCAKFWNVNRYGNVAPENDAHDELINQNVLAVMKTPGQLAKDFGMSEEEIVKTIKSGRRKLREHRERIRPRPNLDDKIVTSWNGLAIGALARVANALEKIDSERAEVCRRHAEEAAHFIRKNLFDERTGRLRRVFREGPGDAPGFADDYASMIWGLIHLYEVTFDESYLEFADHLQKTQISLFWDSQNGGFYSTEADAPDLILRLKDGMDSSEPSTNGLSATNLYKLSSILGDDQLSAYARKTCAAFSTEILQHPFLFSSMLPAVVASNLGMRSVVLIGLKTGNPDVEGHLGKLKARLLTNTSVVAIEGTPDGNKWLRSRNSLLDTMAMDGRPRVQICEGGKCLEALDMKDIEQVLAELG
ncbi:hypothetical protein GP486_001562 [Trichoglossum hirsutum]|uniref:Spermatogenesis-associated protein 20-like TRX domain-containing protein n=1 Tax=Trichoglossum hirsutum TaxID=265104 RepID=A0A9P8RSY3_9PEZI|nr:hypothetical protein GP486_001562 [Trichoglossum hirsutum]